jgi:hypothetical protein
MAPRLCRTCSRPLTLALPPGGEGSRALRCLYCEGPDPLKSPRIEGWIKGLLRDEAESGPEKSNADRALR